MVRHTGHWLYSYTRTLEAFQSPVTEAPDATRTRRILLELVAMIRANRARSFVVHYVARAEQVIDVQLRRLCCPIPRSAAVSELHGARRSIPCELFHFSRLLFAVKEH